MKTTFINYKNANNEFKTVETVGSRVVNATIKNAEKSPVMLYVWCDGIQAGTITVEIAAIDNDGDRIYHVIYGCGVLECMACELKEAIGRAYNEMCTISVDFKDVEAIYNELEEEDIEAAEIANNATGMIYSIIANMAENQAIEYGMTDIHVEYSNNNTYVVVADTKRFGKHEIMFESVDIEKCVEYVKNSIHTLPADPENQEYTSADTSINENKIPAIFTTLVNKADKLNIRLEMSRIFDNGCGKYTEHIATFLKKSGIHYIGRDKYNQPDEINTAYNNHVKSAKIFKLNRIFTSSNVLNVIKGENHRAAYIDDIKRDMCDGEKLFVTVYEGDKSGGGRVTKKDCWQENRTLDSYVNELAAHFTSVEKKYNMLICTK